MRGPYGPAPLPVKFDPEAHRQFLLSGGSVVAGQAFIRQSGGGVITCAGNDVALFPNTLFFRGLVRHLSQRKGIADADRLPVEFKDVVRRGQCDAQGRFLFSALPTAEWLIATTVTWRVGYSTEGGDLVKPAPSGPPGSPEAILTGADKAR